jgi:hypothetical protein
MDYTKTAAEAKTGDIVVNAIYCGDTEYATATPTWREMSTIGGGRYMEIGATGGVVAIATPFDAELGALNQKLNTTYVTYGRRGGEAQQNQVAQDAATATVGGGVALADRAQAKSSGLYRNAHWDLVDASKEKDFKLESVKEDELPAELKAMSLDERKAYVEKKSTERADIQKQIQDLSAKRAAVVKEELAKKGLTGEKAFDENVKKALIDEASQKGFAF